MTSHWLILGTSPAVNAYRLRDVPDHVRTIGVNRFLLNPQGYKPDYLLILSGGDLPPSCLPVEGSLRGGLVCFHRSPYRGRDDAITYGYRSATNLPREAEDQFRAGGGAGCYAMQFALSRGATHIAVLGVDWNATDLRYTPDQATHCYGANERGLIPPANPGNSEVAAWMEAREHAECVNLSPYRDTPFQKHCAWPIMPWEDWLRARQEEQADEDSLRATWERAWSAPAWRAVHGGEFAADRASDAVGRFLETMRPRDGATVFDWGCGSGLSTEALAAAGLKPAGIDIAGNTGAADRCRYFLRSPAWSARHILEQEVAFSCNLMECIPPARLDETLATIRRSACDGAWFRISLDGADPEGQRFACGALRLTVRPLEWWLSAMRRHWRLVEYRPAPDGNQAELACFT